MNHVKEIGPLRSSADSQLEHDLAVALRLQRLLVEISSCFVTRPVGQVDDTIEESQRIVCQTLTTMKPVGLCSPAPCQSGEN
jgi:hypothetical protein